MADDYDFDNEFDVEDFESPAKNTKVKNTKENDPYFKRKQSFGVKDKNDDGFDNFDMEEIKDEDDYKPKPKSKDTDKQQEIKTKIIENKEEKSSLTKKKDDYEFIDDYEVEEEQEKLNRNNKENKLINKTQAKPDSQTFMTNIRKILIIQNL